MPRRLLAALAPLLAGLAIAPAAFAENSYVVFNTADAGGGCAPYQAVPNAFTCDSVRVAVAAANANAGSDAVYLPTGGSYTLPQGQLVVTGDLVIFGQNARATRLAAGPNARVIAVNGGINVALSGITIAGGNLPQGQGGNIANAGNLSLLHARVTGGTAPNGGGGIVNTGSLVSIASLVDNNVAGGDGGGILNLGGGGQSATTSLSETTVAANTTTGGGVGAGVASEGDTGNTLDFNHLTLAHNTTASVNPAGLSVATGTANIADSIFAANTGDNPSSNCGGAGTINDQGGNVDDGFTCAFQVVSGAVQLATTLSDAGGQTDVLTIPLSSNAKHHALFCGSTDQRDAQRASSACDSGAMEEGATAPPIPSLQFPQPPAPTPTPTPPAPTPTPAPTATPVPQQSVAGKVVEGTIKVKKPGAKGFVDLDPTQPIPLGSTIDAKHGDVQITSLQTKNGKPQTAIFFDGQFKITQTKATTDLTLNEALAPCGKGARAAAKKPKTRKLWGNGSGSFRTRGQYSSATVRGTEWLVQDSCSGTLTRVKKGVVSVRDQVKNKTIIVRAPHSYTARPKR